MANGLLDPVYKIRPNIINGIRRSDDPGGRLGAMEFLQGNLSIAGRTISKTRTLQFSRGHLVVTGRAHRFDKRRLYTPGHITLHGRSVNTGSTTSVNWTAPPPLVIDRTVPGYPKYFNNIRSTYLFDPGGRVTSVTIENVDVSVITYEDLPNDRIKIASDPGANVVDTVNMQAHVATLPAFDADWAQRAAGAFYSHNFTYKNAAKTQLIANDTDLHNSVYSAPVNFDKLVWDTSNKLSGGGSARINILASQFGADSGFGCDFAGIGPSPIKTTIKHEFYVQFAYYMDAGHWGFTYGNYGQYGGKIAILQSCNLSFGMGEVVIRRAIAPFGFVMGYRKRADGQTNSFVLQNNTFGGDGPINNFVDLGAPAAPIDTVNKMQQRYGVNYNYGTVIQSTQDADLINAPHVPANTWYVFEYYVKQVTSGSSIAKIWGAPYGQAPVLLMGAMNAQLPLIGSAANLEDDGKEKYSGVQFTNYPNAPAAWPSSNTYVAYTEIIASDNPIPFPGNRALPFSGVTVPTGYPYNGWVEN